MNHECLVTVAAHRDEAHENLTSVSTKSPCSRRTGSFSDARSHRAASIGRPATAFSARMLDEAPLA
ncbi:hypothetical protein HBI56_053650 [Parastagonospora nodorum]|uniref:Uncharacterized protein n=1 Tax=Phaeosphaeria nodorum (strain SN15 / ATCC MYA-4574 / FGSC 10173) TaxID=321614 RepID=A0A7U2ICM3_PHANO|nr:hypothetical protein HBH56_098430 [Parastagonospora nodorum]QRD07376.1 hypothetical protein JI435_424310 [Parastagonospora nodorum SN15]KAH3930303.1 hypothetical protein HBH54_112750 [Parastagonospora nodorum]KAH3938956.1 hypothetical protein HBH53_241920 [Parastagonospora nodorum]KAH3964598.1 hypothetical protein HBH51_159270 [Parastagonospora nodorum]